MSLVFNACFDLRQSLHSMRAPDDLKYLQISSKVEAKDWLFSSVLISPRFDSTREYQLATQQVFVNYVGASKISIQSSSVLSCQCSFTRYGRSSC
jgi:putative NADH-flavin reductase